MPDRKISTPESPRPSSVTFRQCGQGQYLHLYSECAGNDLRLVGCGLGELAHVKTAQDLACWCHRGHTLAYGGLTRHRLQSFLGNLQLQRPTIKKLIPSLAYTSAFSHFSLVDKAYPRGTAPTGITFLALKNKFRLLTWVHRRHGIGVPLLCHFVCMWLFPLKGMHSFVH